MEKQGVAIDIKKKGLPDLLELYNSVQELGGKVIFCELGLEVHDFKEDDLREGLEIAGATTFVKEAEGSTLSLSF